MSAVLITRLRRPEGDDRRDAGMSLVEVLVAMALAGVLLTVVGSVYMSSLTAMTEQRSRTSLTGEARIAMESVARRVRVAIRPAGEAAAVTTATPASLTLYSSFGRNAAGVELPPEKVEYYAQNGCLMEARTPARKLSATAATGQVYAWDTGRRATCLAHVRGIPQFSYYTSAELTNGATTVSPITVPTNGLDSVTRGSVRSIAVSIVVADAAEPAAGTIPVATRVTLTNLVTDAVGG